MQVVHTKNMRAFARVFQESGIRAKVAKQPVIGSRFISYSLALAVPNDIGKLLKLEETLALAAGSRNVRASRDMGFVSVEFELPEAEWKSYYRHNLSKSGALGVAAGGKEVVFDWGQEHVLCAGRSGSGKTVAMQGLMAALTEQYRPDELSIFFATPHVKKDDLSAIERLPHLAHDIAHKPDEIAGMIDMVHRIYRQREASGSDGHKVVLVLDETQHEYVLGEKKTKTLNEDNIKLVNGLATGARGFDMRLVLGSQYPLQENMPGILDNLANRFVGHVTNGAIANQATGVAGSGANRLTGKGDFLHVIGEDVTRFQVAMQGNYQFPSGPMNPLPPMMPNTQETAVSGRVVSFDGDWQMLGRLVAFVLVRRQLPGRNTGARMDMNWKQVGAFKQGFMTQMQVFAKQGTAVDKMAVKWFQNWLNQTRLQGSNH